MLNIEDLIGFTNQYQTDLKNVVREYHQHLFLSSLYQLRDAEKLLFKGGTALRIILKSPRFSEDLDFTGINITHLEVDGLFTDTMANIEKAGIKVEINEGKPTTGGYLGIAVFYAYGLKIEIRIEVSFRSDKNLIGTRVVIQSDYLPPYSLVHVPTEDMIRGKLDALIARHKPRDFYDYFFLLSGDYPLVRDKKYLNKSLQLLRESKIDFRSEIRNLLPKSHVMHLRNFKKILEEKIISFGVK